MTMTPLNTLEPVKANEVIKTLLREPADCSSPCFWGIIPGRTSAGEAGSIFSQLGLQLVRGTYEDKDFASIEYVLDTGLDLGVSLTILDDIVENIRIKISPEKQKAGIPRDWSAYSPEILIEQYGIPSRVDFSVDPGPNLFFVMQIYYDALDLIIQYTGTSTISVQNDSWEVCPLTAEFDTAWIWIGKNPQYPPVPGVPLEKATSHTLDEFSKLMAGDPDKACFQIKPDMFP